MLDVIFYILANVIAVSYSGIQCDCGYGGLCLEVPRVVRTNCTYQQHVSFGYYEADGHTIVDHCLSNPCAAGDCVGTFGGFFCRCPADRIGHRCELLRSGQWYKDFKSREDLYIYYQVQPNLVGTSSFTVVYNSKGNSWLSASSDRIKVWPIIRVTDGRVYYPNHHFVPTKVKESCIDHASKNPTIFDLRVCDLLPSGTVDAFTFDMSQSYSRGVGKMDLLTIPGFGLIGRTNLVNVKVRLRLDEEFIDVYDQNYTAFSYYDTASYRCLIDHTFLGCSPDYRKPTEISRRDALDMMIINKKVHCEGVLIIKTEWRRQRIVQPEDVSANMTGYDIPTYLLGSKNKFDVNRPPFYFGRGSLMMEFVSTLRGQPPNLGSDYEFHQIARCFLKIRAGQPWLATDGGSFRTMSCLNAFALPIQSYNPNFESSDFTVHVKCNVSSDSDCDKKKLTVPILRKTTKPKCDSYYKFTLEVDYVSSDTGDEKVTFITIIHFIQRTEELSIICLDNCQPYINPSRRIIFIAVSNPYSPSPVRWEVESEGAIITQRYGEVLAFRPLTASRILRLNGEHMVSPGKRLPTGSFTVFLDASGLIASLNTSCDNLGVDMDRGFDGIYFNATNEAVNLIPKASAQYYFKPVSYLVFQVNLKLKDEVLLVQGHYNEQLTNIKPDWNTLRICLQDLWRTEYCRLFNITVNYRDPNSRLVRVESLRKSWSEYDLYSLLSDSILFFVQSLTAQSDSNLSWTISLTDRRTIVEILLKFNLVNQNGAKKVFFILSMMFYSAIGNKVEDLPEFKNEPFRNSIEVVEWIKLRVGSLDVLHKTIGTLRTWMERSGIYLTRHFLGSQRKLILRTWSLAYHQEYVFVDIMRDPKRTAERYSKGEALFYAYLNDYLLYGSLHRIAEFLAVRARLYTGIYFLGEENVLTYVVRTSYVGFLSCLNKSIVNRDVDDGFSDYIFEPLKPKMNWVKLIVLEFPPPPVDWEDDELIFVVTAVRTSLSKYDLESEGNPMVNLFLTDSHQNPIDVLPQGYNITIPYLEDGHIATYTPDSANIGYLKKPLAHEKPSKYLYLTSVNLPNHLRSWRLKIILEPGVTIKAIASVSQLPEYEEVDQSPELTVHSDGLNYSVLDIYPVEGSRLIPAKIYLAILPGKLPNPTVPYSIRVQSSLYFCRTFVYVDFEVFPCEGLYQPLTPTQSYFNCTCVNFGLVYTSRTYLTGSEIFPEPLELEIPAMFNRDATIVVGIAALMMVLVWAFVFWKDRKRHGESLIYLEDNYIKDSHMLIVAVYTSQRCSAGTSSKVAIKVEGLNSSSRVHVLRSSKRRTLMTGQDDWFVMTTNEPLGRLSRVHLWADFRSHDDWHCTRILFYDVNLAKWYCVEVNKWIYITESNEESRVCTFQVSELESTDNALNSLPYGFWNHFSKEISNNHLLASMILLHHRSLKTPFIMGNVLLIKIFSLFLSIWCLEEVAYTWFHNNYYFDYYSHSVLIGLKSRTFEDASSSAGLARLVTVPIITLYKALYVSRFLQKRTTNPLYLASSSPKDLIVSSKRSISSSKGRKSSVFDFRSRKSTKISINRPFDSKFGLQRGWRLVATLLFGPSQFRCVNVDRSVFNNRVSTKLLVLRLSTLFLMLSLFASVCFIEFGTEYWRKTKSAGFIFLMAILLDSFLITPSFMLFSSLVSYFVLKASNKEVYLINEETKFKQPPYLDFKQYMEEATKEEYKPILTTVLEGSRKETMKTLSIFHVLNYIMALLAMGLCISSIGRNVTNKYYTIVSATEVSTLPLSVLDRRSYGVDRVNNRTNAIDFIFTNLADINDRWYNGKLISASSNAAWELGGYCLPLNAGHLIMLFKANNSRNYYLSADIQDYQELFPPPCGYLSDDSQRTDPIKVGPGRNFTFNEFSPFTMTGRSRESYPFKGHNVTLPLYAKDWANYYSFLRKTIDAALNRRNPCDIRALLFSWNSVNIFSQKFLTLNALLEFLPSGVTSAKVEINAVKFVKAGWQSHVVNGILSIIFLWNICFVAILFSVTTKHVLQDRILNSLFLIGSVTISILYAISGEVKFKTIHQAIYDPPDNFRDLGSLYAYETAWSYAMASVIALTVLIMAFLVVRTVCPRLLKMSFHCFLCAAFMLMVTLLFNLCTQAFRSALEIITYKPILSRVDAVILDSSAPVWLLVAMFFLTAMLLKLTTASVILASIYVEEKESIAAHSSAKKHLTELHGHRKMDEPRRMPIAVEPGLPKKTVGDSRVENKIALMK